MLIKTIKTCIKWFFIALIILCLFSTYPRYKYNTTHMLVATTCQQAVALHDKEVILVYLQQTSLAHNKSHGKSTASLYHYDAQNDAASIDFQAWVFERHICTIKFHNGVRQEQSVHFTD